MHQNCKVFPVLLFCGIIWLVLSGRAFAQVPAPDEITAEPHHHLLLQNDKVRVFAVTLPPSEHSFVRHQYNFLVITLQDSELVMWNEGESEVFTFRFNQGDTRFLYAGLARGMRNDRTTEYRNITIEFIDPKVTTFGYQATSGKWEYGSSGVNLPVDPNKKFHDTLGLGPASVSDVQLMQRDILPPPDKGVTELLVPVTDIDVTTGSDLHVRKTAGSAWWIGSDRKNDLMNTLPDAARFVVVEFKPAQN